MRKLSKIQWALGFFTMLALTWIFIVPPFQSTDESYHFGQAVARQYDLVDNPNCKTDVFNLLEDHRTAGVRFNPLSSYAAPLVERRTDYEYFYDAGCDSLHPLGLYYFSTLPWLFLTGAPSTLSLYALRLWSLVLWLTSLGIVYRIGRLAFKRERSAFLLMSLIALHPVYLMINSSVNYDALMNLFFVSGFWVAFSFLLKRGPFASIKRFCIAASVLTVLGLLTKVLGAFFPFFFLFAAVLSKRIPLKWIVGGSVTFFLLMSWIVFGVLTYGVSLERFEGLLDMPLSEILSEVFVGRWSVAMQSFWGGWGGVWLDISVSPVVEWLLSGLFLGGILLALRVWRASVLVRYALLCVLFFEAVSTFYNLEIVASGVELSIFGYFQGRYYFPIMLPLFYLFVTGLDTLRSPQHIRRAMGLCLVLFLVYHFYVLGGLVIPRYYF